MRGSPGGETTHLCGIRLGRTTGEATARRMLLALQRHACNVWDMRHAGSSSTCGIFKDLKMSERLPFYDRGSLRLGWGIPSASVIPTGWDSLPLGFFSRKRRVGLWARHSKDTCSTLAGGSLLPVITLDSSSAKVLIPLPVVL